METKPSFWSKLKNFFRPIDLTQGSCWQVILKFAVPILICNLLNMLYSFSDAAICGQTLSADEVAGCDFLCGGTRTEITKQGTIGSYDASWVETHWQHASPGSDAPEEWSTQMLLLYDREKLCVVIISADWDDAERIAEHLEIVETSVDAPQPDLTNGRGFRWIGGVG